MLVHEIVVTLCIVSFQVLAAGGKEQFTDSVVAAGEIMHSNTSLKVNDLNSHTCTLYPR